MMQWSAALATSEHAPDLIVTEILTPDSIQHKTGYESLMSHWSIMYSDALVGQLIASLQNAGRDDYNLAIMSDHGHMHVKQVIHPEVIIPDADYAIECGWLYVHFQTQGELKHIAATLADYGVELSDGDQIPEIYKNEIAAFMAPEHTAFEPIIEDSPKQPMGQPCNLSSHGFRPGTSGDDRFCMFYGPDIKPGNLATAEAIQIMPTLAHIIGLNINPNHALPLF
jgi:predicted AlkP superfamily pyrophosphatase or phosphodiesterase